MAINRYKGNSGRVSRVDDGGRRSGADFSSPQQRTQGAAPRIREQAKPPGPLSGLSGELERLFSRFALSSLETEDLIIIAVLYLLYKESGDMDYLIMMGAMLLL